MIANGVSVDANGDASQRGRLIAATLNNYELSAPIDLGVQAQITGTSASDLYFRCNDRWGALNDNDGVITIRIKAID